ncbi:unnamed protein product [Urochloa decumbens]|uniref:PUM-HD domain-containing protein n=1 Tax=Urochloa decumbens TaxID=240449 RepID=A0ABC8YBH4_9POAL
MEPTKQSGADPSDLGASSYPAQLLDGSSSPQPALPSLVEQAAPPNPLRLLQPPGDDVVGESSTRGGIPTSNGDFWCYGSTSVSGWEWPAVPNLIDNPYYQSFASDAQAQSSAAATFSAGGQLVTTPASASTRTPSPFAYQAAPYFDQWPSTSQWASMPSSSSNGPQPGAASAFSPWGHNASIDPYAPSRLTAPRQFRSYQIDLRRIVQAIRLGPREFRARLLSAAPDPAFVMSPKISERVALMLNGGHQDLRVWVLEAVLPDARAVMGSRPGSAVFLALLRAVVRAAQSGELAAIVDAVASPGDRSFLMDVANRWPGERALKELFRVVAHIPQLCQPLFNCLINGWIMERRNGLELLHHLFTTLDYRYCRIFIRHLALPYFRLMVTSESGWRCLLECLDASRNHAPYTDLRDLERTILWDTVWIAKDRDGNYFLQEILKSGRYIQLADRIRNRVERNLQYLSKNTFASFVVQACYLPLLRDPERELALLRRGLDVFGSLRDAQLIELVHHSSAGRVLRRLLDAGIKRELSSPEASTMALARRINGVMEARQEEMSEWARLVMQLVSKVLSFFMQQQQQR